MTRKENNTKKNNFEIIGGKLFQNGHEIVPRVGIKPVSKEDSLKEVKPTPATEPKKRKRWYRGSFLTQQQDIDEQKQLDDNIA